MKFLADECCDAELVEALAGSGYDVLDAVNDLRGASDEQVLERAYHEGRIIITEDKDFGELTYRLQLRHCGILLLRLNDLPRKRRIALVIELLENHFDKLRGKFSVLTPKGLRIKTIPKL